MESTDRYPEVIASHASREGEKYPRFAQLREDVLVEYGFNTARAYWGDLQDWYEWALERGKDVLNLTLRDKSQYIALLRRRKYSESTIRRRQVALRHLERKVARS